MKNLILYLLGSLSPKLVTHILYFKSFHRFLNLKHPKTLNEKIQWIKFYGDTSQWSLLSDKYKVREYVKERGLSTILVELYGVWKNAEDIDWEVLPDKFVMKANNGCGDIVISKDKNELNKIVVTKYYSKLLKKKFGISTGQIHYKCIMPCIIAEELLDSKKQRVESSSLIDYKLWCINGKPQYVFICCNRQKDSVQIALYDMNWQSHSEYLVYSDEFRPTPFVIPQPKTLLKMIKVAEILSEGHPQMRVDLYEVDNTLYFGELTMTSACGIMTYFSEIFLIKMGNKMNIPV